MQRLKTNFVTGRRFSPLFGVVPILLLVLQSAVTVSSAHAQGVLVSGGPEQSFRLPRPLPHPRPIPRPIPVPQPSQSYKIRELGVNVNLADQIAKVQMTQTFVNTGSRQMEVSFVFPLPYNGAVDRMTFLVDGKEFEAKLLDAKSARRIYEDYIRRNQDPALMEWFGGGMFKTSVFPVPPGAERTVMLRYTQLCRKSGALTELVLPLGAAKYTSHPVENVSVNVSIESQGKLKNVYSPTHSIEVSRPSDQQATAKYAAQNATPAADFRLLYDTGDQAVGASVLSYRPSDDEQGYFLMLLSPEIPAASTAPPPKTVIFVVDRSGSMSGKKIEQARASLKFVLNNLRDGDLFNVVAYDSAVESFRPELQRFNDQTRKQALGFVDGVYAGGSTNIDGALQAALSQLSDDARPSYVIFLTDGLPTVGERKEPRIVANAKNRNKVRARIFALGVGYDVNSRLLDKLVRAGFGQSEYVRPNEDIEDRVSRLYRRIGAPVMTDLKVTFDMEGLGAERGSPVTRIYPRDAYDLFAGDPLVMVGRYKASGAARVQVAGSVGETEKSFDFPVEFSAAAAQASHDERFAFVEKIWAMRRVGEIIDEIDLHGKNQELIDELVSLSKQHGILTPYTSFLADENANLGDLAGNRRRADVALQRLSLEAGKDAFAQRAAKGRLQRAAQAPAAGAAVVLDAEEDKTISVGAVKTVGRKTFFLRDGAWTDSTLSPQQKKNPRRIRRFSRAYFDLFDKHGRRAAKYLAMEETVLITLDGQTYLLADE